MIHIQQTTEPRLIRIRIGNVKTKDDNGDVLFDLGSKQCLVVIVFLVVNVLLDENDVTSREIN